MELEDRSERDVKREMAVHILRRQVMVSSVIKRRFGTGRTKAIFVFASVIFVNSMPLMAQAERESGNNGIVLENDYLSVLFSNSQIGPKLKQIEDKISKRKYSFEDSEQLGLVVVRPGCAVY